MAGAKQLFMVLILLSVFLGERAYALDLGRRLTQLHHTRWTIEDGAPPDIWALAQATDGYLWLGTGAGLFRFDGVSFEKLALTGGDRLPSSNITALLAESDGDVWIGYVSGDVSRYHHGRLSTWRVGLPTASVFQIARDPTGIVWAALKSEEHGGLVRYDGRSWRSVGPDLGLPSGSAKSVLASRDGAIWVNLEGALYVKRSGATRFTATGDHLRRISCITESPGGDIWVSSDVEGQPRRVGGPTGFATRSKLRDLPAAPDPEAGRMIVDRDGALWGTYQVGGLFRLTPGDPKTRADLRSATADRFALADGLSSDIARPVLEDREGNIWVGSNLGLDRFRATNVVAASGVPVTSRLGFVATAGKDAALYVATTDSLYRVDAVHKPTRLATLPIAPTYLYSDRKAVLWVGLARGIARFEHGRLVPVRLPADAGGMVASWTEDPSGTVCIAVLRKGIYCGRNDTWWRSSIGLDDYHTSPLQMLRDRTGRVWLNYEDALATVEHGILHRFTRLDGPAVGKIGIVADGPTGVMVGGDFGLARFDGKRFITLDADHHPALARIAGIVTTPSGDTWINGIKGVSRISGSNLAAAFARPSDKLKLTLFDMKDGMPGVAQQDSDTPTAIEGSDGRLWFITSHGVAWLDPSHLVRNLVPPPVSIKTLIANGIDYPHLSSTALPAGSSNIEIDYTALSLSIPERVQFRYRLTGVDNNWVDPGSRRQAFYTKLGPGTYHFQVIAANNDGVWNRSGATLDFMVPPTFVQSGWFTALLALAALCVVWLVYSLRVRQITGRMREGLEVRLGERERIARELHDTLLQGFQGLVFRFQAAANHLQSGSPAREMVERALDQADDMITEGRNRVFDLRTGTDATELSDSVAKSAKRILATSDADFQIIVEGHPRVLHQIVHEELVRIAEEALSNAARHAHAGRIEVSIAYGRGALRLHVRDNGVGMSSDVPGSASRHFGMLGMRERAATIGSTLTVSSHLGAGTDITLSIPAKTAYASIHAAMRHSEI